MSGHRTNPNLSWFPGSFFPNVNEWHHVIVVCLVSRRYFPGAILRKLLLIFICSTCSIAAQNPAFKN